jgi:MYND finger
MRTPYPACINCGGKGNEDKKLAKCGKCLKVQYCNRQCQAADWKVHKAACKK